MVMTCLHSCAVAWRAECMLRSGERIHGSNVVPTMLVHGIDTLITINVADFTRFDHHIALVWNSRPAALVIPPEGRLQASIAGQGLHATGLTSQRAASEQRAAAQSARRSALGRALSHAWVRELVLLLIFEAAGIAATWPRFTWLANGKMPATSDESEYVWDLWWVAHQLAHLSNPFFTTYMAAPVGTPLGFSTLMPLVGWIMAPVTILFGPSAAFTLLTIVTPGLLCYVMYRMARLWLTEPGAIVAGGFLGLSSMLMWQNWYHINIALGTIFLPVTIEAAVRFTRGPRIALAVTLGLALGASVLGNQKCTAAASLLAGPLLLPWLAT